MRTDEELGKSFRRSEGWKTDAFSGEKAPELDHRVQDGGRVEDGKFLTHSHSGHERNHLFLSSAGTEFTDISTVSGLDSIADSRGFVLWDYDRDGWQDIALVNANAPLLNVYRNQIGSLQQSGGDQMGKMIAVRLVGGNVAANPSTTYGPRDGYGAKINVSLADLTIQREHRCGDGFAVQNSNTMIVGIGDCDRVESVEVVWPSGRTQTTGKLAAGTLLTVYENPSDAPDPNGFVTQPYVVDLSTVAIRPESPTETQTLTLSGVQSTLHDSSDPSRLKMYTTMATWCAACKRLQPQLDHLRAYHPNDELEMYGVPVDTSDTSEKLHAYMTTYQPPYELVWELTEQERAKVERLIGRAIKGSALPSTVITDSGGKVLHIFAGVPTVSDLGRLRAEIME